MTTWGAFAEEIAIDAKRVVRLPPSTDLKIAVAFGLTYGTSYHALKDRAQIKAGETLLVLGAAGGVGIAAEGRGVDVVYDPVGGNYAEPAVRGLAWKRRYPVVGFTAGDIPKIPLDLMLLKGASIVGVFWGPFTQQEPKQNAANIGELMQWLRAGEHCFGDALVRIGRTEEDFNFLAA